MIIGIDGNEANIEYKAGVHQYTHELLHAFYRINQKDDNKHTFIIYLKSSPRAELPKATKWWQYKILPARGFWILTRLMPRLLLKNECDVLFSPNHYLPILSRVPMICTIHDLGYLNFSGQFRKSDFWQLKTWTAISLFVARRVISVSQSTKVDIVRHYPFARKKVKNVYHGYDKTRYHQHITESSVTKVLNKFEIPENYILFLSTLKPSKNIEGLLEAYRLLRDKGYKERLVVAGKKGWLYKTIFNKVEALRLTDYVIFTDYVDEEDKGPLMKGARVFVTPSFWEGFGMQVLESMAVGTPVVVSKVASLPEVAGDAGIYIDPNNPVNIAEGIEKVLSFTKEQYNKLQRKSLTQASQFSWDKTGEETLNVIKNT